MLCIGKLGSDNKTKKKEHFHVDSLYKQIIQKAEPKPRFSSDHMLRSDNHMVQTGGQDVQSA